MLVGRMREFGPTIFAEMTQLAVRTGAINLGQGFPDQDGPAAMLAGRHRGDPERPEPVRARPGRPRTAAGDLRPREGDPGPVLRPRHRDPRHRRRDRGDRGGGAGPGRTGRRGDRLRAVLRLLPGRRRAGRGTRRAIPLRPVDGRFTFDPADLTATPRTKAIIVNSPHNPTGTVFTPRRTGGDRRVLPRQRRDRDHRRGLRTPDLRRGETPLAGRVPRNARADGTHFQRREIVLGDRLENRLDLFHAGTRVGGDGGETVSHLHLGRSVAARRRPRAAP